MTCKIDIKSTSDDADRVISEFVPFLSSAVHQLRSKDIVHFDLKPGNILRCGNVWKVTDFDAAEFVFDGGIPQVSRRGSRGFTDPKMLQEGGGVATSKTDLYSAGAILYALVMPGGFEHLSMVGPVSPKAVKKLSKLYQLKRFIQKLLSKEFKTLDQFYIRAEELMNHRL